MTKNKPIIITSQEAVRYEEVIKEWSYEEILDLFPDGDGSLVNPLVRRCQEYEVEIDRLIEERQLWRSRMGLQVESDLCQENERLLGDLP
jgi:hypothetical protein